MVANGVEDAVADEGRQKLFDEQGQENGTDGGQEEVVDHEDGVELESRQLLHDFATTEDDHIVGDQEGGGLLEGGDGSDALGELELAGGVTHDHLVGLIEQRPQVDAEGTVQGREGHILKKFGHGDWGAFFEAKVANTKGRQKGKRGTSDFEQISQAVATRQGERKGKARSWGRRKEEDRSYFFIFIPTRPLGAQCGLARDKRGSRSFRGLL